MKINLSGTSVFTKISLPLILVSVATSSIQTASAKDSVTINEDGSLEINITANRRAQTTNTTLAPVTIITRDDIEKYQAQSLFEVLRRVPGINISNNGGVGTQTSVFMRGTNSGHVLVLVDGIRHGSATLGSTSFQHIPLDQIERIEVVRGPRSSLYGSEAIGGVIQIITRKGGNGFKPSVKLGIGSHDTLKASVNIANGHPVHWYNINLQSNDTMGFDSCNSTTAGCFADEPDKDGYHQDSISLRGGRAFNANKLKAEVSFLRAQGDTEFDGSFQNSSDFVQQVASANLSAKATDKLNIRFQVGQSRDENKNFKAGTFASRFNTERDSTSLIADVSLNDRFSFLLGTDWHDDKVDSTTDYAVSSRDSKGVFGSVSGRINKTQVDLSLRDDDNEQFGNKTTGGIAIGQQLSDNIMLKASYGTAFKAPTFNQLYFPDFGLATLKPEESENYELGLSGQLNNGSWEVNVFENQIENLIAGFPVSNLDEARIRGLEAGVSTKLAGFDLATNVTLQKPENRSGANAGKLLRERPRKMLNLDIDRKLGRWSLGASVHSESVRFSDVANKDRLAGFTTLDLRSEYALAKNWRVGLKVANALDKDYITKKGYNQDGINGMLSIKYAPK